MYDEQIEAIIDLVSVLIWQSKIDNTDTLQNFYADNALEVAKNKLRAIPNQTPPTNRLGDTSK